MIDYDWVDCSKDEYDKHWMEGAYRRIPIYPEDTVCHGILFFMEKQPDPIGYKYQKGINPRYVLICNDPELVQKLQRSLIN